MGNFYNPYMSNGNGKGGFDIGQGIDGIINQITQLLMLKKMGGAQGKGQTQPQDPNAGGPWGGLMVNRQPRGPQEIAPTGNGMGGQVAGGIPTPQEQNPMAGKTMNQLTPQMIQMLLKMFGGGS